MGYVIIVVYVDELNIIRTSKEIQLTIDYLKREFKMKDLAITKYCLGLQFEHTKKWIFVHQKNLHWECFKAF